MNRIDFQFFYKYSVRLILSNKYLRIENVLSVPKITKLFFFFQLSKIADLDDTQIYNYTYLFKYFFGRRAFLTKIKSFFNVGIWSYSLRVSLFITGRELYLKFFFILNDIISRADKRLVQTGIFNKSLKIFYIVIADMNVFAEKKTNLGLFYLNKPLNLHIFCSGVDFYSVGLLLKNLKLKLC